MSKKQEMLNNYWDSKIKEGMSTSEIRELDNWMAKEYKNSWVRKTKPTIKDLINRFIFFVKSKFTINKPKKEVLANTDADVLNAKPILSKKSIALLVALAPIILIGVGVLMRSNKKRIKKR